MSKTNGKPITPDGARAAHPTQPATFIANRMGHSLTAALLPNYPEGCRKPKPEAPDTKAPVTAKLVPSVHGGLTLENAPDEQPSTALLDHGKPPQPTTDAGAAVYQRESAAILRSR